MFVASGVSGLIYEIVWLRKLALVFGSTVQATSTVLTAFMGGLALGSWALGRYVDRHPSPLKLYAYLEVGIAVSTAVAMLGLLPVLDGAYVAVASLSPAAEGASVVVAGGPGVLTLRFVMAVLLLIVPTTLMGGTLPVMTRFLVTSTTDLGQQIGRLYALNTVGAMMGCALAGFVMIRSLGEATTVAVAVANNLAVAAVAWMVSRSVRETKKSKKRKDTKATTSHETTPRQLRAVLIAFGFAGFASLAFEVVWARALVNFMGSHVYSFTAILTTFLFGITAGSAVASRFVDRVRRPLLVFGLAEIALGLLAIATIPMIDSLSATSDQVVLAFKEAGVVEDLFWLTTLYQLTASFFVFIGPTFLMGAVFPLVNKLYDDNVEQLGRKVGNVYSVNTVGTIIGSAAGGFFLLPTLGVAGSIVTVALVNLTIGVVIAWLDRGPRPLAIAGTVAAVAAVITAFGVGLHQPRIGYLASLEGDATIPYVSETPLATLYVREFTRDRNIWGYQTRKLCINHACTAHTTFRDVTVHKMLAHVPLLLHPRPKSALVVGFGLGSTSYSMLQHPDVNVDCVELIEEETETAPFFEHENHGVIGTHPRYRLFIDDGRNYVLATDTTYDVISVNAVYASYSPEIYTKEYFELCKEKMSKRGLMALWLPTYGISKDAHRSIYKAFRDVFGHSFVFYSNQSHFLLIGSAAAIDFDLDRMRAAAAHPDVTRSLAEVALDDVEVLLSTAILDPRGLGKLVDGAPTNSDANPIVEFDREDVPGLAYTPEFFGEVVRHSGSVASHLTPSKSPSVRRVDALNGQLRRWMGGQQRYYGGDQARGLHEMFGALAMDEGHHFLRALTATYARSDLMAKHFTPVLEPFRAVIAGALARNPEMAHIHDTLATASALLADYESALYHRSQLMQKRPDDPMYAYSLGLDYLNLARPADARRHFESMVARPSLAKWGHLGISVVAENQGDTGLASEALQAALAIDPEFSEAKARARNLR